MTASTDEAISKRLPLWPLLISPLVAATYYVAMKFAFARSITSILQQATDVNLRDWQGPHWGSHWIYRAFAEIVSVAFGTFIAAGIARHREKLAAVIGGLAISLFYIVSNSIALYVVFVMSIDTVTITEPWSQHIVEALLIIAAPLVGAGVSDVAKGMTLEYPKFHGINRWHFLWLWIPTFFYALGLVSPVIHFWFDGLFESQGGAIGDIIHTIAFGLPILFLLLPLLCGLGLLSGRIKSDWPALARDVFGSAILILGLPLGATLQYFWGKLLETVFS